MYRRKAWSHSRCPRCTEPFETNAHISLCPAAKDVWSSALSSLDEWLAHTTSLDIRRSIISRLRSWHDGSPPPTLAVFSTLTSQAVRLQDEIGWHSFLGGFLSTRWVAAQEEYVTTMGLRSRPLTWCSTLITKLWQLTWDLWDDRNNTLHHNETGAARQAARCALTRLHSTSPALYPQHCRSFFDQPLQVHLDSPYPTQSAWLRRLNSGRERLQRRADDERAVLHAQRQLIYRHFDVHRPAATSHL